MALALQATQSRTEIVHIWKDGKATQTVQFARPRLSDGLGALLFAYGIKKYPWLFLFFAHGPIGPVTDPLV